jgi:hypothetical protein
MDDITNRTEKKEQIKKDLHEFSTPLWYYKLVTKDDALGFRALVTIILPAILAAIIAYTIYYILDVYTPYYFPLLGVVLFFIFWIFFFYLFWIKLVKKIRFNVYERFAMHCK